MYEKNMHTNTHAKKPGIQTRIQMYDKNRNIFMTKTRIQMYEKKTYKQEYKCMKKHAYKRMTKTRMQMYEKKHA